MLTIIDRGARSHLPFSPAIVAGDLVFVSGQASVDATTGQIMTGTFEEEFRRSMDNLTAILAGAGVTLDHVINVRSYLGSETDGAEYNALYREYFGTPLPTRSTISGVLGKALKFEIDCIAYRPMTRAEARVET